MLLARGTTCMLCMVCSTFCFSALKVVVLHSQESFFLRIHLNFFSLIRSCTSSQQDLRRLSFLLNSLSLTLQPLRPLLAKVNKTYEQYCHFNDPVVVLLVGKIHRMKFLLSCTSSQQDLRIQLVYLVRLVQCGHEPKRKCVKKGEVRSPPKNQSLRCLQNGRPFAGLLRLTA